MRWWRDSGGLVEDSPLFPDAEGNMVSATAMIALVDELAVRSGESVTNADGLRRFGRHSWRSTGAVWLTGTMGIEVLKVQMMARWSSPVVTHYTRLAPLKAITSDFRKAMEKKEGSKAQDRNTLAMERSVKKLTTQLLAYEAELNEMKGLLKKLEKNGVVKKFVTNRVTGIKHRILTHYDDARIAAKTICKWKYLQGDCELTAEQPRFRKETCETCMRALKASLPQ